jgi:ribosomal protein S18 acetylase RimI-like enzyme
VKISLYSNCSHSPAWPMIPEHMDELVKGGLAETPYEYPAWNDVALVAFDDEHNSPIGFLIYRYYDFNASWFIMQAYVRPEHRRRGVHTALFEALVARARARKDIREIRCGTSVHNHAAQAAFEKQGRKPYAIYYGFEVPGWTAAKDPMEIKPD